MARQWETSGIAATEPELRKRLAQAVYALKIILALLIFSLIVVFQAMNSILTKGVLRAGGDTKFLMAGDILFLWVASIPLGALAGLVWHWPPFWIYSMLKIDQIIKCVWCFFRLKSRKWMKKISAAPAAD